MKFRLGLFERPYVDPPDAGRAGDRWPPRSARLAADLAARSIVLVENDGMLPLAPRRRPDRRHRPDRRQRPRPARRLRPPAPHRDARARCASRGERRSASRSTTRSSARSTSWPAGRRSSTRIRDALRRRPRSATRAGTGLRDGTDAEIAEAVAAARDADVAIVVLGERSGLTDDATTGEFRDRRDLGFLGRQQELLEAVVATGTPVVLVVVSGRPLAIEWAAEHCAASCSPGCRATPGRRRSPTSSPATSNPGGKLPVTMPRHVGQVPRLVPPPSDRRPVQLEGRLRRRADRRRSGRSGSGGRTRRSSCRPCASTGSRSRRDGGEVVVTRRRHEHRRSRAGDEVVQLYVRDEEATRRPAGPRAARLPSRRPRARRVPDA